MELENNVQAGEVGERRKSFLERLGLVEPVQPKDETVSSSDVAQAEMPRTPEAISSLFSGNSPEARAMQADITVSSSTDIRTDLIHPLTTESETLNVEDSELKSGFNETATQYQAPSFETVQPVSEISARNIETLTIAEIYTLFNLKPSDDKDTIYLVENFMQALPINLPFEVKKDSLFKLLQASSFSVSDLRNDGNERIRILERYLDDFTKDLEDIILYNEEQVKILQEKIKQHKQSVAENQKMISEQKSLIKFEAQRISALMDSIEKR